MFAAGYYKNYRPSLQRFLYGAGGAESLTCSILRIRQFKGVEHVVGHLDRRAGASFIRKLAGVAAQQRLGILPERGHRFSARRASHSFLDGPFVVMQQTELRMMQIVLGRERIYYFSCNGIKDKIFIRISSAQLGDTILGFF